MRSTPPRQLRAAVAHQLPPPVLTRVQEQRQALILATAPTLFAEFGRASLTLPNVAAAIRIPTRAFRELFLDLDALLGDLLRRHCQAILDALRSVPRDTPNRALALCAAYHAATRLPMGHGYTDTHLLLVRDLSLLPDDERTQTEAFRRLLGQIIAGPHAESALRILDDPNLTLPQIQNLIEKLLGSATAEAAPAKPRPPAAPIPRLQAAKPKQQHPQNPPWNRHQRRALTAQARAGPPPG